MQQTVADAPDAITREEYSTLDKGAGMRLRLRLLLLMISTLWRKPSKTLVESELSLRVLPNDVDIKKITNDRYFALLDLGRLDIAFRMGLLKKMIRKNWVPVATFFTIRFRYPLKVFQKYQLRTRIIYWDDRTFYFHQDFERKGRIVATAYSCSTLLGPQGPVKPRELFEAVGVSVTRPEKPDIVATLQALDESIHQDQQIHDPTHS
jgi:acyl-CoA thioesterase FadM